MVLLALRKIPTANPRPARRLLPARPEVDADLPMQRRRLGFLRQGLHQGHPGKGARSPITTPCWTRNARTSPRASWNCWATRISAWKIRRCKRRWNSSANSQEEDGSWYGRWGVNYIYGTWQVLRGLRALGLDMSEPWILKARDWLESVQHEDGGWGERCDTYDDPVFKGQGPSTASQTAWAVMGLCAFDDPNRPSLQNGIEYLVRTQNADGTWSEAEATGTGFPAGVLFEVRHVSEQLAVAGPGDLSQHAAPGRSKRQRMGAAARKPISLAGYGVMR